LNSVRRVALEPTLACVGRIKVLIVDDDPLARMAMSQFVSSAEDLEVVGEAEDGEDAVRRCGVAQPDVVLMDVRMPGGGGVAATAEIVEAHPSTRVLAITTLGAAGTALVMLRAGAAGYLFKDTAADRLVTAVRETHAGRTVLAAAVASELVAAVRTPPPDASRPEQDRLSDRELRVVEALAQGMSNAEIAASLYLAEATVKTHLSRIMTRWGVRDRVQLLLHAARAGIITIR
jgi:DNA-binding NarL/FixJ family response regulator